MPESPVNQAMLDDLREQVKAGIFGDLTPVFADLLSHVDALAAAWTVRRAIIDEVAPGTVIWLDGEGWAKFDQEERQSRAEVFDFTATVIDEDAKYQTPYDSRSRAMRGDPVLVLVDPTTENEG